MKISPLFSREHSFFPPTTVSSSSPVYHSSLQRASSCTSPFFSLFSWLFGTPKTKKNDSFDISPSILSSRDPFRQRVFDNSLNLRSPKLFEAVFSLFEELGTTSYKSWIWNQGRLNKKETHIKTLNPHPFETLYFLLCNKTSISHLVTFEKESEKGKWLLKLKTGRSPWEEFLQKNTQSFERKPQKELLPMVPGFCKGLGLKESPLLPLAKQGKWEDFILEAFKQRKESLYL